MGPGMPNKGQSSQYSYKATEELFGGHIRLVSPALLYFILVAISVSVGASIFIRLDKVVTGRGIVISNERQFYIDTPNTSTIQRVVVKRGDVVRLGQVLAEVDSTGPQTIYNQTKLKSYEMDITLDRLKAELHRTAWTPRGTEPFVATQLAIYRSEIAQNSGELSDIDAQVALQAQRLTRSKVEVQDAQAHAALVREAEKMNAALVAKGWGSRAILLKATDDRIEAEGRLHTAELEQKEIEHGLEGAKARRLVLSATWRKTISDQMSRIEADRASLDQEMVRNERELSLTTLRAPADAVVMDIADVSQGSVANRTSEGSRHFFTLSPVGQSAAAELDLAAKDIGFVHKGDRVTLKLDAYNYTSYGVARGRITSINQGFQDSAGGMPFGAPTFKARIDIEKLEFHGIGGGVRLVPGMTFIGDVIVGGRTVMDYLMEGVLRTKMEALREP